jgi:hypothetical protein
LKKMDFTCPNGQVGQKVNVEPWMCKQIDFFYYHIINIFYANPFFSNFFFQDHL